MRGYDDPSAVTNGEGVAARRLPGSTTVAFRPVILRNAESETRGRGSEMPVRDWFEQRSFRYQDFSDLASSGPGDPPPGCHTHPAGPPGGGCRRPDPGHGGQPERAQRPDRPGHRGGRGLRGRHGRVGQALRRRGLLRARADAGVRTGPRARATRCGAGCRWPRGEGVIAFADRISGIAVSPSSTGVVGCLVTKPDIQFVKAAYRRPYRQRRA